MHNFSVWVSGNIVSENHLLKVDTEIQGASENLESFIDLSVQGELKYDINDFEKDSISMFFQEIEEEKENRKKWSYQILFIISGDGKIRQYIIISKLTFQKKTYILLSSLDPEYFVIM